jgi:hypothetical protein
MSGRIASPLEKEENNVEHTLNVSAPGCLQMCLVLVLLGFVPLACSNIPYTSYGHRSSPRDLRDAQIGEQGGMQSGGAWSHT